ncbi:nucleoside/nucleotide kinase family protein [Luteipulveratus halotolerans]|uniref:Nucleoside kinase n=1 Tax=Luteipulveratus halotolerans TaxID=1631356 RepID=A0A0L6CIA3_9MICO|nr:nucleoside kinase [Luteipulveratus halotolerans]KNX37434.1 nucleoside kinase [Luteipulveratus halotolerans]
MGARNVLVEGVSCSGKTSVATELERRGHHVVHGDRVLAYRGDPESGEPVEVGDHENHLWDVDRVRALAADDSAPVTFFCGGSRNHAAFIDLFDEVFVLDIDAATLERRLDERPHDEFGSAAEERALVRRLHRTQEDVPDGVRIDATRPLTQVVDDLLRRLRTCL